jgi:hypothetical protein
VCVYVCVCVCVSVSAFCSLSLMLLHYYEDKRTSGSMGVLIHILNYLNLLFYIVLNSYLNSLIQIIVLHKNKYDYV